MATEARFSPKEAAMLANACIASTTADTKLSLLHLIDEKKISEAARKAAGSSVTLKAVAKEIDDRIINARMAAKPSRKRYVGETEVMYMASACLAKPLMLRKVARTKVYRSVIAWAKGEPSPAFRTGRPYQLRARWRFQEMANLDQRILKYAR